MSDLVRILMRMVNLLVNDPGVILFLADACSVRAYEAHREDLLVLMRSSPSMPSDASFRVAEAILRAEGLRCSSESVLAVAFSLLDYALFMAAAESS